jgi:hypothetical protein
VPRKDDRTREEVCVKLSGNEVYEDHWHGSCVAGGEGLVKYCNCLAVSSSTFSHVPRLESVCVIYRDVTVSDS